MSVKSHLPRYGLTTSPDAGLDVLPPVCYTAGVRRVEIPSFLSANNDTSVLKKTYFGPESFVEWYLHLAAQLKFLCPVMSPTYSAKTAI